MVIYLKSIALVLSMLVAMPALAEQARQPVADKVTAYSGTQGVKVWTLRIGERSANQALVQVDGIDHDWRLKIQKMDVEKTSRDMRYSTLVNGEKFVALIVRGNSGELYLPGELQEISVKYDDVLSGKGNAEAFLTDYLK